MNTAIVSDIERSLHEAAEREIRGKQEQIAAEERKNNEASLLGRLLRGVGTATLLAAATVLMAQSWGGMDHIQRCFTFLGFIAATMVSGLFCGLRIREDKGARTLVALALAMVPVHFAQLGGLIYSRFGAVAGHDIPSYFQWIAPNALAAVTTAAVSTAVLGPIVYGAFAVLFRAKAAPLAGALIVANALLLIPIRTPVIVGILALGLFVGAVLLDYYTLRDQGGANTGEGRLARFMLLIPAGLLLGRNFFLYSGEMIIYSSAFAMLAFAFFVAIPAYFGKDRGVPTSQTFGAISAAVSWLLLVLDMQGAYHLSGAVMEPVLIMPFCTMLVLMSFYSFSGGTGYRNWAAVLSVAGSIIQVSGYGGTINSLILVLVSILVLSYGYAGRHRGVFALGLIGFAIGLACHISYAIEMYSISPWLSLGLLGIFTILGASYVEKNHRELKKRAASICNHFSHA